MGFDESSPAWEDGTVVTSTEKGIAMPFRLLRFYAGFLNFVGWVFVIGCTGIGFLPWILSTIEPMPVAPRWQLVVTYGSPVAGFLVGLLGALWLFVVAQLIRLLVNARDLLEQILDTDERLLGIAQSPAVGRTTAPPPPVAHIEPSPTDEKTL